MCIHAVIKIQASGWSKKDKVFPVFSQYFSNNYEMSFLSLSLVSINANVCLLSFSHQAVIKLSNIM